MSSDNINILVKSLANIAKVQEQGFAQLAKVNGQGNQISASALAFVLGVVFTYLGYEGYKYYNRYHQD
jgi:hypothetical protein